MGKITVLHVIGRRPKGGIGSYLLNMNRNIDRSRIQFDYLINAKDEDGEFDKEVRRLGGNVYLLPELKLRNLFILLKKIYKFYDTNKEYDIVQVHSPNIVILNFIIAKIKGIDYRIAHSHSIRYSDKFINSIRNFFLQLPVRWLSSNYVACSVEAAVFLFGKKNVANNRVEILKNAIETEKFLFNDNIRIEVRKELGIVDKQVVGHVGNFMLAKNHDFIIDIFKELYKKNKDVVLLLVGSGEFLGKIIEKVDKLSLQNVVKFLGNRKDVNRLMQAFDVFILPSLFEGFPLVGVEAQAAGLPCLFSNVISHDINLTGKVYFHSIKADPVFWADEIQRNLKLGYRDDTSNSIVSAGFDVETEAKELEKFYVDLLVR